jgi:hypothetical protein
MHTCCMLQMHRRMHAQAISRLRDGLAAGDAYEAQQGVKTTYYRLKARRQTHDGYDLLQQASVVQFGASQFTCGVELAKLLLEVRHKRQHMAGRVQSWGCVQLQSDAHQNASDMHIDILSLVHAGHHLRLEVSNSMNEPLTGVQRRQRVSDTRSH